jgi:DNA invertase Pin-like site-specific DNA recombinase
MQQYFGYIRVSTPKQGEKGVSLQEQKSAILNYARRFGLEISQWFEELETAAKRGRSVFTPMLRLLRQKKARGVIIHKIDRSARNLKDWADLGEMIDAGIEVHFANESLDLNTRGGRLSVLATTPANWRTPSARVAPSRNSPWPGICPVRPSE